MSGAVLSTDVGGTLEFVPEQHTRERWGPLSQIVESRCEARLAETLESGRFRSWRASAPVPRRPRISPSPSRPTGSKQAKPL